MRPSATCACASRPTRTTTCAPGPQGYGRCWTMACASTATSSTRTSRRGRRTRRAWSSCWPSELHDLLDGVAELVVAVEEVRAEAQADIGTAVADDLARGQLAADCLVVVDAHRNRAARAPPQSHLTEPPTAKSTPSAVTSSGTVPVDWYASSTTSAPCSWARAMIVSTSWISPVL